MTAGPQDRLFPTRLETHRTVHNIGLAVEVSTGADEQPLAPLAAATQTKSRCVAWRAMGATSTKPRAGQTPLERTPVPDPGTLLVSRKGARGCQSW